MKLEAINITKQYNQRKVVDSVSFEIQKGEIIGLLGPNGAGKTTSFYILVGLINHVYGQVLLDGEDISNCPMYIRARKGISYLAQEASIFRKMSVEDNILCVLESSMFFNIQLIKFVDPIESNYDHRNDPNYI